MTKEESKKLEIGIWVNVPDAQYCPFRISSISQDREGNIYRVGAQVEMNPERWAYYSIYELSGIPFSCDLLLSLGWDEADSYLGKRTVKKKMPWKQEAYRIFVEGDGIYDFFPDYNEGNGVKSGPQYSKIPGLRYIHDLQNFDAHGLVVGLNYCVPDNLDSSKRNFGIDTTLIPELP